MHMQHREVDEISCSTQRLVIRMQHIQCRSATVRAWHGLPFHSDMQQPGCVHNRHRACFTQPHAAASARSVLMLPTLAHGRCQSIYILRLPTFCWLCSGVGSAGCRPAGSLSHPHRCRPAGSPGRHLIQLPCACVIIDAPSAGTRLAKECAAQPPGGGWDPAVVLFHSN